MAARKKARKTARKGKARKKAPKRNKVGQYCSKCRGPHIKYGHRKATKRKPRRETAKKRSSASVKGWAHRRGITTEQERHHGRRGSLR